MNISRLHNLTKELIAIDSVTGREGKITDYLERVLTEIGMQVHTFCVEGERRNILATWDAQPPRVMFNTHLDTVPPQYGPHEDDTRIYGRGACDTHGILAAQLEAVLDLHAEGIDTGLLLVVGEETIHDGALHAGKGENITEPEILIVGEPTENKFMTSQKGRLKADLLVHGREGHSGYPERFDSAVEKLCATLQALWNAPWLVKDSAEGTTMNATIVHGGDADNKVPGLAHARLMFRCAEPCSVLKQRLESLLQELEKNFPSANRPHFEVHWEAAETDPLTDLASLPGFETAAAAFNTDIAYFGWTSCRTFLIGPGSILQAHRDLRDDDWQNAEWISKEEQVRAVDIYKQIVKEAASVEESSS